MHCTKVWKIWDASVFHAVAFGVISIWLNVNHNFLETVKVRGEASEAYKYGRRSSRGAKWGKQPLILLETR